ncbi:coiled-coil domain-containing protein [Aureliella helgolandensis]|uniref:Outer membrane efflux protein n=1 Tax=Aureliella helgolandensis TaxID=2527968 RepID=A0A518G802_9BACT|nr:hypothetical protein [Aureliella helgolandensis]QDV24710.1 hypothetical protein Q31a_30310 [Aureliella helgolandensis]
MSLATQDRIRSVKSRRRQCSLRASFRQAVRAFGLGAAFSASLMSVGCSRQNYRCKTDTEAYYLLDEKVRQSCEVVSAPYRVEIDGRSRMFDPFNPDRPPMPEDDPQAAQFMRVVDGKKGYPLWEANGRTNAAENPEWWNYLPLDERGVLVLDLNEAVRTALLHSPSYQSAREELYLSALDVSSERFLLDSQFFGGWQGSYTSDGPRRGDPTTPESSSVFSTGASSRGGRPFSMRKRFATGADLLVGFANNLTWQVAGPNDQSATSLLDFTLLQPLLRQGGRDVVLERLTLAERTLLANVRAFERYRRAFYVDIATGRNSNGTGPQRRGGVFGGSGFEGFSALGGIFSGGGSGGGGTSATPGAQGYLGLLQSQLNIANQQENILQLEDIYLQFQDGYRELQSTMPEELTELPQQQLQVAKARQNLFDAQTQLLSAQTSYEQTLDGFKADLGLPPYLCVEIRDPLLEPFKLISQELRNRRLEVQGYRKGLGETNTRILELARVETNPDTGADERVVDSTRGLTMELSQLLPQIDPVRALVDRIAQVDIRAIENDIAVLRQNLPTRLQQLEQLRQVALQEKDMVCSLLPFGNFNLSFLEGEGLEELPTQLESELAELITRLEKQRASLEEVHASIERLLAGSSTPTTARQRFIDVSDNVILASQDFIADLNDTVLALQIVQARARTESVLLPEIDIDPQSALEIARSHRRDWLNNRAAIVNTWRSIEVVADDLESYLDLTFSGDVQNVGDNPLALRSSTGRLRVGLAWDAPITRLQERNNYRQVLITYQRAKRSYYQFEDGIWSSLRSSLRTVRQNQLSFEIQRFAVQNAALQNSVNADIRLINETLGRPSGNTAALDAFQGLDAFLRTQNTLIGIYVNFEALRRSLDLDLGTMELDAEGLWIDPGPIRADTRGGALGNAILDYGLNETELELREQMASMPSQPLESAPSSQLDTRSPMNHLPAQGGLSEPTVGLPVSPNIESLLAPAIAPAGNTRTANSPVGGPLR